MTSEIAGLDFSATKPDPAALTRAGFRFVMGYLKPLLGGGVPNPYELTAAQIAAYRAAGLQVGVFWETTADAALSGAAGGDADGARAVARAKAVGYPAGCVIVAAVDFDASAAQLPAVVAYVCAFDSAVRAAGYPGGGYGGLAVVEALHAARPSLYLCQTAAWSGGRLSPHAHLYQRAAPSGHWPAIAGTDEEVLCQPLPLYGSDTPTPTPAPAPKPVVAAPPFPLPAGSYFGPKDGPAQSVSGYYSHAADLACWQQRMRDRGWTITADGRYGDQTAGVARRFQAEKRLAVDGLIGPTTWVTAWTAPVAP